MTRKLNWLGGRWGRVVASLWEAFSRQWAALRTGVTPPSASSQAWDVARGLVEQRRWPDAMAALDKALALVPRGQPQLRAEMQFDKGYALEQMGELEQALMAYAACSACEESHGLSKHKAVVALRQGNVLLQLGRRHEAEEKLGQCRAEARRASVLQVHLNALRLLLGMYQSALRYAEAAECAQEAVGLTRSLGDKVAEAFMVDLLGDLALASGREEDALRHYELSLDRFRQLGHTQAQLVVQQDIAKWYVGRGDVDKALAWLRACLEEGEHSGNLVSQARLSYEMGCLLISDGRLQEAGNLLGQSMGLFRRLQDKASLDQVGRTLMGLGVLIHRQATAGRMTFRDVERGGAKLKKEEGES